MHACPPNTNNKPPPTTSPWAAARRREEKIGVCLCVTLCVLVLACCCWSGKKSFPGKEVHVNGKINPNNENIPFYSPFLPCSILWPTKTTTHPQQNGSTFDLFGFPLLFFAAIHDIRVQKMSLLHILYQDEHLIAIQKPHGLLVHHSPIAADVTEACVQTLRDQIGQKV